MSGSNPARSSAPVQASDDLTGQVWRVRVGESVYGPYTVQQMAGFVLERRVKAHTLVQGPHTDGFVAAGRVTDLLSAFAGIARAQAAPVTDPDSAFYGRGPSEVYSVRAAVLDDPTAPANFVISGDIRSGEVMAFEAALAACGPFVRASEYMWVLRARMNAASLRKALSRPLKVGDKLLIVDATRDRLSWYNIGPQNDVALRQLWDCELPE